MIAILPETHGATKRQAVRTARRGVTRAGEKMAPTMPPPAVDSAKGSIAKKTCGEFVSCVAPLMEKMWSSK
jgi:hypothetical protein